MNVKLPSGEIHMADYSVYNLFVSELQNNAIFR